MVIPGRKQQNVMRVQDKMVLNIVDSDRWRKPVYFAVTVSDDNFMGLDPYLQMEGLVYRINPRAVEQDKRMDIDKTAYLLDKVYRFGTGKITDEPVDEAARGLEANYTACYVEMALSLRKPLLDEKAELDTLQNQIALASVKKLPAVDEKKAAFQAKQKDYEDKLNLVTAELQKCITHIPWDWRPRALLQEFYLNHGKLAEAEKSARDAIASDPTNPEFMRMLSQALEMEGKGGEAIPALKDLIARDPNYYGGFESLARDYVALKHFDSAIAVITAFEESHPGDKRAEQFRQQLMALSAQQQMQSAAAKPVVPAPVVPKK